ncbi:MAG: ABC transporter permease [archaeon]
MIADFFMFSCRNIRNRKVRSYLTMIGIFIGIAAVVSLIGLGEGLRMAITGQFGELGTDVLTVQAGGVQMGPPGSGVINPLTVDDAEKIRQIPGVKYAISRLVRSGRVEFRDHQKIEYIVSLPDGDERRELVRIMNVEVESGRLLKDGDLYKVVLGANYVDDKKFGQPVNVGQRVTIEGKTFEAVGIMKSKGSFLIDNAIVMNDDVMRDLYNDHDKVDILAVIVRDEAQIKAIQGNLEKLLRKERNVKEGEEDFSVETPENAVKTLNDSLFAVQLFVYIIAGISLLVGGIGIMNTMYTAVLERTKEIGIMKSIGARNSDIFTLFFIESGLIGSLGGLIGMILGVLMATGLSAAGRLALGSDLISASFSPWLLAGALAFSFTIGSLAGIAPALSAARLHPVDALRFSK